MKAERFIRMPQTAWIYPALAALFYGLASALGFSDGLAPGATGIALAVLLIPVLFGAIFAAVSMPRSSPTAPASPMARWSSPAP